MKAQAIKTGIFKEGENLINFILRCVEVLPEKSILVVTSKIVSLWEGRTKENVKGMRDKLIAKESDMAIKNSWLSIKNNIVMAAGGVDESNGNGKLILLPKDSFRSAEKIRSGIRKNNKIKNLGIIIADSNFIPMRQGAIGVALGYSGIRGVKNYIGGKDIFGRKLKYTTTNVADSLATAAVLVMGEGKEQQPLALITDAPVIFHDKVNKNEMRINPKKDMYNPLFKKLKSKNV